MPITYDNRQSSLAKKICSWFQTYRNENISFGAILDKYCENGMPRRYVANLLREMKGQNNEKLGDFIPIKDTTLWEAWKAEVAKERTSFAFHSKFPGNKFHGNKGKIRALKWSETNIPVTYTCTNCGQEHIQRSQVSKAPRFFLVLKGHQCPDCRQYGTSTATFVIEGIQYHKAIVDSTETFMQLSREEL